MGHDLDGLSEIGAFTKLVSFRDGCKSFWVGIPFRSSDSTKLTGFSLGAFKARDSFADILVNLSSGNVALRIRVRGECKSTWAQTELTSFVRLRPRYLDTVKSDGILSHGYSDFTFHSCPSQDHSHHRPNPVSKRLRVRVWSGAHYVEDEAFTMLLGTHGALTPSQPDSSAWGTTFVGDSPASIFK
jgi:hypothetical protein